MFEGDFSVCLSSDVSGVISQMHSDLSDDLFCLDSAIYILFFLFIGRLGAKFIFRSKLVHPSTLIPP